MTGNSQHNTMSHRRMSITSALFLGCRVAAFGWLAVVFGLPHVVQAAPSPPPVPAPAPVPLPAPPQQPSPQPSGAPGDRPVVGAPTVSFAMFQQVVRDAQSPIAADAQAVYNAIQAAGIDPNFALAIMRKESTFATAPTWAGKLPNGGTTYNWGNVRCAGYTRCVNGWRQYPSWTDATTDWIAVVQRNFIAEHRTTVRTIIEKYAPRTENDTEGYIADVVSWMGQWGQNQTQPAAADDSWLDMYVLAPKDDWTADAWKQIAETWWPRNQSLLQMTNDMVDLRTRLTPSFQAFLDALGLRMGRLGLVSVAAAVLVAGLALLGSAVLATRQTVVDLRTIPTLLFVFGVVLPSAGALFVAEDRMEQAAGDALYQGMFAVTDAALRTDAAPTNGLGDLPVFCGERDTRRAVDVAAAYLFVTCPDLQHDETLPAHYAAEFYPVTGAALRAQNPDLRQIAVGRARRGEDRQFSGLPLTALGLVDEGLSMARFGARFIYTVAIVVVCAIAVFKPTLALLSRLGNAAFQLFCWGLLVALVQGLCVAWLFHVAAMGTPGQVSNHAVGLLIAETALLAVTLWSVVRSLWGSAQAIGRFTPIADAMTLTDAVGYRWQQRQQAHSTSDVPAPRMSPMQAIRAYSSARMLGLGSTAAVAYAGAPSPRFQQMASVMLPAGALPPDVERAIRVGASRNLGQPGSFRSVAALRDAFPRPSSSPPSRVRPTNQAHTPGPDASTPPAVAPAAAPYGRSRVQPSQGAQAVQARARARRVQPQGVV